MRYLLDDLYRRLLCRGGHGVHSPFVFDLITNVFEEKNHYYCYDRLHKLRKRLQREAVIHEGKEYYRRFRFSEREDRMLFRLANRLGAKSIFVCGSDWGLTPLYLTAHASDARCSVLEAKPHVESYARRLVGKYAPDAVEIDYDVHGLLRGKTYDMAVWDNALWASVFFEDPDETDIDIPFFHNDSVMVVVGIRASAKSKAAWATVCAHPKVTVAIDMGRLGLVFFNPSLHRRIYKATLR